MIFCGAEMDPEDSEHITFLDLLRYPSLWIAVALSLGSAVALFFAYR